MLSVVEGAGSGDGGEGGGGGGRVTFGGGIGDYIVVILFIITGGSNGLFSAKLVDGLGGSGGTLLVNTIFCYELTGLSDGIASISSLSFLEFRGRLILGGTLTTT